MRGDIGQSDTIKLIILEDPSARFVPTVPQFVWDRDKTAGDLEDFRIDVDDDGADEIVYVLPDVTSDVNRVKVEFTEDQSSFLSFFDRGGIYSITAKKVYILQKDIGTSEVKVILISK